MRRQDNSYSNLKYFKSNIYFSGADGFTLTACSAHSGHLRLVNTTVSLLEHGFDLSRVLEIQTARAHDSLFIELHCKSLTVSLDETRQPAGVCSRESLFSAFFLPLPPGKRRRGEPRPEPPGSAITAHGPQPTSPANMSFFRACQKPGRESSWPGIANKVPLGWLGSEGRFVVLGEGT